jgi:hypothetical protein
MTNEIVHALEFVIRHVLEHCFSPHIPFGKLFRADRGATL